MKFITGFLVLAIALGANSQQEVETLLSVQDELAHTHRFFETIMGINRGQLSAYIYRATRAVLNSHLDTYEFIFVRGAEARDHINSLQPGNDDERACVQRFLNRFELQKQRFGQRLARCVGAVQDILLTWNNFVNGAHREGQLMAASIQNLGFNLFAGLEIFDGPEDLPALVKVELRNIIFRALGVVDTVEEFIRNISDNIGDIEFDFVRCDKELEEAVVQEIAFEVNGANACVGAGPIDPDPTH